MDQVYSKDLASSLSPKFIMAFNDAKGQLNGNLMGKMYSPLVVGNLPLSITHVSKRFRIYKKINRQTVLSKRPFGTVFVLKYSSVCILEPYDPPNGAECVHET